MKWFTCGADQAVEKCHVTLADLDKFVRQNAPPDVGAKSVEVLIATGSHDTSAIALSSLQIRALVSGEFDDPALCRLISGKAKLISVTVTKL